MFGGMLVTLGLSMSLVRDFKYVNYGGSAPAGQPAISCDGKVPGAALDLTHWSNNETPNGLYADTSTEIALKMAKARLERGEYAEFDDATVVNNHYDTDGVLAVWACTNPEEALRHSELMVAGAEAGDFGEWSSELGVKLDLAISALCTDDDDEGYGAALHRLPELLRDFETSAGAQHEGLWREEWEELLASWEALESGASHRLSEGKGRIVLIEQPAGSEPLHGTALHRGLRERGVCGHAGASKACNRVLRATHDAGKGQWSYVYEKPGHGWVQRLVERETVPLAHPAAIAASMNGLLSSGGGGGGDLPPEEFDSEGDAVWKKGGASGLGGQKIGWTSEWVDVPPEAMLQALVAADEGAA